MKLTVLAVSAAFAGLAAAQSLADLPSCAVSDAERLKPATLNVLIVPLAFLLQISLIIYALALSCVRIHG